MIKNTLYNKSILIFRKYSALIMLSLLCQLFYATVLFSETIKVAVITTIKVDQFKTAATGFEEKLKSEMGKKADTVVCDYYDTEKGLVVLPNNVYNLVYAVGIQAVKLTAKRIKGIPLVFSIVFSPEKLGIVQLDNLDNIVTGVSLDLSPKIQLELFKRIMPTLSNIGLLYSDQNSSFAAEAVKDGQELNISVKSFKINTDVDVVQTLKSSIKTVDALWLIPDTIVCTKDSLPYILKYSLEKKKPVIGFADYLAKAGALFSYLNDYEDSGRQAADLAVKILAKEPLKELAVRKSRKIKYVLNLKIANFLEKSISEKALTEAQEVYK